MSERAIRPVLNGFVFRICEKNTTAHKRTCHLRHPSKGLSVSANPGPPIPRSLLEATDIIVGRVREHVPVTQCCWRQDEKAALDRPRRIDDCRRWLDAKSRRRQERQDRHQGCCSRASRPSPIIKRKSPASSTRSPPPIFRSPTTPSRARIFRRWCRSRTTCGRWRRPASKWNYMSMKDSPSRGRSAWRPMAISSSPTACREKSRFSAAAPRTASPSRSPHSPPD